MNLQELQTIVHHQLPIKLFVLSNDGYVSMRMTSPDVVQLSALPRAWTPSTNGIIRGAPVKVKMESKEDLEKNKGKLSGKFVLLGDAPDMKPHEKAQYQRYDEKAQPMIDYFLAFEEGCNRFPGFSYEVQGVYQEPEGDGVRFYTYVVRELEGHAS